MRTAKELKTFKSQMKGNPTRGERDAMSIMNRIGFKYKPQVILGFYILDFIIWDRMINVEIDGDSHCCKKNYDNNRDSFVESLGFNVIRIKNNEVNTFDWESLLKYSIKEESVFRSALARANVARGRAIKNKIVPPKSPVTIN